MQPSMRRIVINDIPVEASRSLSRRKITKLLNEISHPGIGKADSWEGVKPCHHFIGLQNYPE